MLNYRQMEDNALEVTDAFREDVKESKYGTLKLLALDILPITVGASVSGVARLTGHPELIAVPPVMDLYGGLPSHSPRAIGRTMWGYAKYALGASLPYIDKVSLVAQELLDKF